MLKKYPKITVVTPNFNQTAFLERTIQSVLNQGYPNLEYIIIDGGSKDGSVEIIEKYEEKLSYWESKSDNGMYHAIQKGFDRSTGEIMAWINSDDVYLHNCLFTVAEVFSKYKGVKWVTSNLLHIDENDRIVNNVEAPVWSKYLFFSGKYKWIQQESTFWRRNLWEQTGGKLDTHYNWAADLELWSRFFLYAELFSVRSCFAGFRIRTKNQKSLEGRGKYFEEVNQIYSRLKLPAEIKDKIKKLERYAWWERKLQKINMKLDKNRYERAVNGYPKEIVFNRNSNSFELV